MAYKAIPRECQVRVSFKVDRSDVTSFEDELAQILFARVRAPAEGPMRDVAAYLSTQS
jgi:hypothetical protein